MLFRCCSLMETQGHARTSHKTSSIPKQLFLCGRFPIAASAVACSSKVSIKENVKLNKPFIFGHEFPFVFQGFEKSHTRQERCSWLKSSTWACPSKDSRATANLKVILQCLHSSTRNVLTGLKTPACGKGNLALFRRPSVPLHNKVVEIATWLILPVAYACLKD